MNKKNTTESEIIARIKQSLDNYEEGYIPGSWETFLQKRKKNNRKIFLRIASGIAACLLLGYLGFLAIPTGEKDLIQSTPQQVAVIKQDSSSMVKPSEKAPVLALVAPVTGSKMESPTGKPSVASFVTKPIKVKESEKQVIQATTNITTAEPASKATALNTFEKATASKTAVDTILTTKEVKKGETAVAYLPQPIPNEEKKLASLSRRKVRFGINFSPGVSNAQSSSSMNLMGGLSADISLSSKFQLSTGLQVENQNIVKSLPGIVASSSFPQNQTKTKLINLDLPVNLTWKFVSEKSHAYYVSAGLSSLVYLRQENKNTTYSQDLTPVSSLVNGVEVKSYYVADQISVTQNTVTPDQTFDFAGRINFMVGFEKKLSEKLFIHFEPYTKIPTSGQAAGSMNHTTTGINFKISF